MQKAIIITLITLLTSCCQKPGPVMHSTQSAPSERTSINVYIQSDRLWAYYKQPAAQFTLYFCNEAQIEVDGYIQTVAAQVFQIGPGEWVAEMADSNYIRLNIRTGVAETKIKGITRIFAPDFIKKTQL